MLCKIIHQTEVQTPDLAANGAVAPLGYTVFPDPRYAVFAGSSGPQYRLRSGAFLGTPLREGWEESAIVLRKGLISLYSWTGRWNRSSHAIRSCSLVGGIYIKLNERLQQDPTAAVPKEVEERALRLIAELLSSPNDESDQSH